MTNYATSSADRQGLPMETIGTSNVEGQPESLYTSQRINWPSFFEGFLGKDAVKRAVVG